MNDIQLLKRPNVAAGKPATQSSISRWSSGATVEADAAIAVSGEADGTRFFHTEEEYMPWWQVDLQDEFVIREIRLHNRPDQPQRLRRFSVLVALADSPERWIEIFRKDSVDVFGGNQALVITLNAELVARFVRIGLNEFGTLHLCQCEVLGEAPSAEDRSRIGARMLAQERARVAGQAAVERALADGRNGACRRLGSHLVFVDTDNYSPAVIKALTAGYYEVRERQIVRRLLRPTDRVLEIGTAIGAVAMTAADIVGAGNVATYDANPEVVRDARRNFAANRHGAIASGVGVMRNRARWIAAETHVDFFISSDLWGSRLDAAGGVDIVRDVRVPLLCLEDRIAGHHANVLICDIEGGEGDLLDGADMSGIRLIVMETHYWAIGRRRTDDMLRSLVTSGFAVNLDFTANHIVVLDRDG